MLEQLPITSHVLSQPVKKFRIGSGEQAFYDTVNIMADIIKESAANYYVRKWAENITQGIGKNDYIALASRVAYFIFKHTRYLKDIDGMELLKTPIVSLQLLEAGDQPAMDCDDFTILSLSLLKSIGFEVAIKAGAFKSDSFNHVYGMIKIKGIWTALDLTMSYGLGWEPPAPLKVIIKEVL